MSSREAAGKGCGADQSLVQQSRIGEGAPRWEGKLAARGAPAWPDPDGARLASDPSWVSAEP